MPKKPTPAPKTVKPDQIILAIDRRRDAVLDVIRAARERLLISMFRCTDVPVLDAIAEALNRKVDVRLLITPRARGWQKRLKELGAYLESMGAKVHPYSDPVVKYHAKYVLADDGPALVGSLNFTAKCFAATCDFILITHDPDMIASLKDLFEVDWLAPHSSFPSRLSHRLIVGPDRARAQFTAMLEDAKRSIYLIDHKLDDPTIKAILKAKKAAGVEVRVLGEGQLGGMLSHGKLIIVDGRVAAIGAMALSALSLDFRREVSVKVDDARCIRKLRDFFNTMAQESERMNGGRARGNARARKTHA
jgi:phosphatidylserine/phosphatidylglycerophosphate/cardiolipin synthase-like enzyme